MNVVDIFCEDCDASVLYACVENSKGQRCYVAVSVDFVLENGGTANLESADNYEVCKKYLESIHFDIESVPYYREASLAVQYLYKTIIHSDQTMLFVEEDDEQLWNILGLTKEEFEQQADSDIEKFGLQDVICKYDEGTLYTIYGGFMSSFVYGKE